MNTIHVNDASEILGVSQKTIYNMINRGELPDPITRMGLLGYIEQRQNEIRGIEARLGAYMQREALRSQIPLFKAEPIHEQA